MSWKIILRLGIVSIIGFVVAAGANLFVARILGPAGRGHLTRLTLTLVAIQIFSEFGILGSCTHFAHRFGKEIYDLLGIVRHILYRRTVFTSLIFYPGFVLFLKWLTPMEFVLLAGSQLIVSRFQAESFLLQGLNLHSWNRSNLAQSLSYAFLVLILALWSQEAISYVLAFNLSYFLSGMTANIYLKGLKRKSNKKIRDAELHSFLNYGRKNFVWILANQIMSRIDLFVLAILLSSADLGVYSIALSWSMIVSPIYQTIGTIGFVEGSRSAKFEQVEYLREVISKFLIVSIIAYFPIILTGNLLVKYFLGQDFLQFPELLPPVVAIVTVKSLIQVVAQVYRSLESMRKSVSIQMGYSGIVSLTIFSFSCLKFNLLELLYALVGVCLAYILCSYIVLRRSN